MDPDLRRSLDRIRELRPADPDTIPIVHRIRQLDAVVNDELAPMVARYYVNLVRGGVSPQHAYALAKHVQERLIGE